MWLVAIIVVIGAWYLLAKELPGMGSIHVASTAQVQTLDIQDSSANYDIVGKYPSFGVAPFDAVIKNAVDTAVMEIKNAAAPNPATYKNALDIRFSNAYIGPDILSVELAISQYTGGAQPLTIISGLNYDRVMGKVLTLNDVLPMIGLTIDQLAAQATEQLKAKLNGSIFPEGLSTNPENFSSFAVSADKVTFIFQPNQVTAYAAGPQEVSFPRTKGN